MLTGPEFDRRLHALAQAVATTMEVRNLAERRLIEYFVRALMEAEAIDSLQIYRSNHLSPWYEVRRGWFARRYFFGLENIDNYLVVKARGRDAMAGTWYFAIESDGVLGANHNGTACEEHKGLSGFNLMVAVLQSVLRK